MTFPTEAEAREFLARVMATMSAAVVIIPTTHGHWVITSASESERPAKICSICGEQFHEPTNNAQPINRGRCCAYCDDHVVTPARIERAEKLVLPTYCFSCGVYLMGGATEHKPGCEVGRA